MKNFSFIFSTSAGSHDPPPISHNRHVSLANIATAFLTERKSSSLRHGSGRRKNRSTIKEKKKTSQLRHQSSCPKAVDTLLGQRLSSENGENGISTIFMINAIRNNRIIVEGEHRNEDTNRSERSYFYKSTTLPPGTQIDQLQSQFNDKFQLKIEAPYF
ncbi:unnamed protein product [Adineta steineri]|uniref:SHSP domain-containing protein n=1 Tax=Adineta steineri TaxID=433720 RepID=A0A813T781_9BILA|nr:unnamed protein product [Adineta steineri]